MTTTEETADALLVRAAEHVRERARCASEGPWLARFETNDGWPIDGDPEEVDDEEQGDVALVAGTALPRTDPGQEGRSPAQYQAHHILAEHDAADYAPEQAQELLDSFRWAAMLGPQIAETLTAVFDSAAYDAERGGADRNVVALARLVLGEVST